MDEYDEILGVMSAARDRQARLVDDLVIAHYKGYGVTGGTAEEITEEIEQLETTLVELQGTLDALDV